MLTIHEQVSKQFLEYIQKGQGSALFPFPVWLEPSFKPFSGYSLLPVLDDGKRPTWLSHLTRRLSDLVGASESEEATHTDTEPKSLPSPFIRSELLTELRCTSPCDIKTSRTAFEALLSLAESCEEPLAFEYLGTPGQVIAQLAMHPNDLALLEGQILSYFPESAFVQGHSSLGVFKASDKNTAIIELGLEREFFYCLTTPKTDALIGLFGALSHLAEEQACILQVIFTPCRAPWKESLLACVSDAGRRSIFVNSPELPEVINAKTETKLQAVVIRIAATAKHIDDAWAILRSVAACLRVFSNPNGNELVPLSNEEYPFDEHFEDLLNRQSRRTGMLLTTHELYGIAHFPTAAVNGSKFASMSRKTKRAPDFCFCSQGLLLGTNLHAGVCHEVRIPAEERTKHQHVIGASGTGKSTFLFNSISQDISSGEGLAVLDPHGDLIDSVLGVIPEHRINDVILLDPSDESASIPFNVLSAHSELEKSLLASDLVAVFRRLSQAWGDQMESVLRNAILAILESTRGGNLVDLRRFLLNEKFRADFLTTVTDPDIRFYWENAFPQLHGNKSIGPVLTRLDTFLSPKPLRYLVGQQKSSLDFLNILDSGKILLAKLSQGMIGKENSFLLGSLLMTKLQQAAMSRQRQSASIRRDFWIYIDEFQNFITPTLAEILSGARKYRVGMVLAHQELRQLEKDREVASAVLANCSTRIVFRVGDSDAKSLESGFASFKAIDFQSLGTGEAIARVEKLTGDFNLDIPNLRGFGKDEEARRLQVTAVSKARYATPRQFVEDQFLKAYQNAQNESKAVVSKKPAFDPPSFEKIAPVETPELSSKFEDAPQANQIDERPSICPKSLGRGGEQHKAIQYRVKESSDKLGYQTTLEYDLGNNRGSVDVALLLDGRKEIAVEIGITTTVDHEVGNIIKCLRADFRLAVVVGTMPAKIAQIKNGLAAVLSPELLSRVRLFSVEEFLSFLPGYYAQTSEVQPSPIKTVKRRGYKVTRSVPKMNNADLKQKEINALKEIAKVMKGKSI